MSDHGKGAPALTFVVPTWDTFDAVRTTVAHLTAQTIAESIELIICAPSEARVGVDTDAVRTLHSVRVLETGSLHATGPMRAMAVRAAAAPVVAFGEDHCYPQQGWAEALLAAHAASHAAVGPALFNGNPVNAISWADIYIEYGRWLGPGRRREVKLLPGHNSSYKRDVLLQYGSDLDRLMESETVLFWDLRSKGHTLLFEPAARVAHHNFTRLGTFFAVQWLLGRVFAAMRAERWSLARRLAYAAASPAIPLIRLGHVFSAAAENRPALGRLVTTLPLIAAALVLDAFAQATGAVFGAGRSIDQLTRYEFHRSEVNQRNRPLSAV